VTGIPQRLSLRAKVGTAFLGNSTADVSSPSQTSCPLDFFFSSSSDQYRPVPTLERPSLWAFRRCLSWCRAPWHKDTLFAPYRFFDVEGVQEKGRRALEVALQMYERFSRDYHDCDLTRNIGDSTLHKAQFHANDRQSCLWSIQGNMFTTAS
jgi:hypothetical protein